VSVHALLAVVEARDPATGLHTRGVIELAGRVARRMRLTPPETETIRQVAALHDIGKVATPDRVLLKAGPLDEVEWAIMREHPVEGERIVSRDPELAHLAQAIRASHERWDGQGYPDGLAGEEIPLSSRITLACDAFDAMITARPYRPAMSTEEALEELRRESGGQFCPRSASALLDVLAVDSLAAA
jgi:HD-GYP domain-containing protein (c-di-GMP phosphodiesterase class II)